MRVAVEQDVQLAQLGEEPGIELEPRPEVVVVVVRDRSSGDAAARASPWRRRRRRRTGTRRAGARRLVLRAEHGDVEREAHARRRCERAAAHEPVGRGELLARPRLQPEHASGRTAPPRRRSRTAATSATWSMLEHRHRRRPGVAGGDEVARATPRRRCGRRTPTVPSGAATAARSASPGCAAARGPGRAAPRRARTERIGVGALDRDRGDAASSCASPWLSEDAGRRRCPSSCTGLERCWPAWRKPSASAAARVLAAAPAPTASSANA